MSLRVTKASDYAVRAMIGLACLPEDRVALRSEISDREGIPPSFTAKILRGLVRAGLLNSSRGVHGGFKLARRASEITLLEIVEAIDGRVRLIDCAENPTGCDRSTSCPAAPIWTQVQESVRDILGGTTLEGLVSTPRIGGRVDQSKSCSPGTSVTRASICVGPSGLARTAS